jgi:hypothetical protein
VKLGEWTRQTRWAHSPAPPPDDIAPDGTYVRLLVWSICPACDLQVHGALTVARSDGLRCPECGGELSPRVGVRDPGAALQVAAAEARLAAILREDSSDG